MACIVPIARIARAAPSDTAWHEGFEGPNPSWRVSGADMEYRIDEHGRHQGGAHTGQASEQIRVTGSNGTYIYFSHPVPPSQITSELAPSVWIKADRPGLQILARIVLPNLIDPKTRQPAAVFIRGTSYSQVGIWQQLRIENAPLELERQLRVLRLQLARPDIDARGAYLDQVWLNVFGGTGTTNVAIDDLELTGIVDPALGPRISDRAPTPPFSREPLGERGPAGLTWAGTANPPIRQGGPAHDIKLDGSVLLVDGHPFFPRILRYQGESLEFVAKTGFNAIRLTQPPPPQLLADAERLGLWIVCPPPRGQAGRPDMPAPLAAEIGPEYDSVLAWHLGEGLTGQELSTVTAIARQLELLDSRRKRPIICAPETDLRAYSSRVNYLCFSRAPLGTSIELGDYTNWLRERPRLARPGTPFWTTVQTELSPAACEQAAMFSGSRPPIPADGESLRMLTYSALSAGARGIEFRLESSLDSAPQSLQLELALLNLELELVEPWAATGSFVTTAASLDQQIVGAVLQTQTTHLLLPIRIAPHSQYIPYLPEKATHEPVTIVVPGIPEWHSAFELTPAGLLPLKHTRGTGGEHITIDDFQLSSMVLITADPVVIDALTRRLAQLADRSAPLQRELTAQTLAEVEAIDRRLPHKPPEALPTEWLAKARAGLAEADKALAGDRPAAYRAARKAIGPLEQLKRYRWEQVLTGQNSLATSPFYASFETLPDQWRLIDQLRFLQPANNQLPGGDCENLDWMMQQQWKHVELPPQADLRTYVELSTKQPHGGKSSLHLQVKPTNEDEPPALVETAPVWVTTPPIGVQAHELLAIRGFVRVPTQIAGSIDGLMILDSIGGESLAERIDKTNGWREFIMYRVAPRDGTFTVTFALTGLGDAWIDDVSIAPVTRLAGNELGRMQPLPPNGGLPVRR
ncbi:MAG TPA: hypothetical protein VG056_05575 [Pirellulales bacterium]|nr:hypothetical protein [Pirellulales bacterium]